MGDFSVLNRKIAEYAKVVDKQKPLPMNLKPGRVGCGDEGTASFAIDAVRKLTTSYVYLLCQVGA